MKIKLLIGFSFFSFAVVCAQETPVINKPTEQIGPSPTVASLGTYGGVELKKSTGGINKTIPLFQLQQGTIEYNPSIEYYSTGVRVDEWGGGLGIDWSDNFTATIQRTVGTIPDEYSNRRLTEPVEWYFLGPATLEKYNELRSAELNENLANGTTYTFDPQYDIFSFNLFGKTGQFVIVNNNAVLLTHTEKTKIEILRTAPTYSFCLTDVNGFRYFFQDDIEYTSLGIDSRVTPEIATAWFITKVISPQNDELTFTYTDMSYAFKSGFTQQFIYKPGWEVGDSGDPTGGGAGDPGGMDPGLFTANWNTYGAAKAHVATKKLYSVAGTKFKLMFNYVPREDLIGGQLVKEIVLSAPLNVPLSKVVFEYGTYTATSTLQNQWASADDDLYPWSFSNERIRYFLQAVHISGYSSAVQKTYRFSYRNPENLPPRLSLSQDEGGYYNGISNHWFIPKTRIQEYIKVYPKMSTFPMWYTGDRRPTESAKTGVLTKITYPTGGYDSIDYELNSYTTTIEEENVTTYSGEVNNLFSDGYDTWSAEEFDWLSCDRAVITLDWDVYDPATGVSEQDVTGNHFAWFYIDGSCCGPARRTFYVDGVAYDSIQLGVSEVEGARPITVVFENNIPGGDIGLLFKLHGRYTRVKYQLNSSLTYEHEGDLPLPGLRVKQVLTRSHHSPNIVKKYDYKSFQLQNNKLVYSNSISSHRVDQTNTYVKRQLTQQPDHGNFFCLTRLYYYAYSNSRHNPNVFNGYPIAYSCVTETQQNTFTASVFDVAPEAPGTVVFGEPYFLSPKENNAWNNGLEKRRYYGTVNSSQYMVQKEQQWEYNAMVMSPAVENCDFYQRYSITSLLAPVCSSSLTYEPFTILSYNLWHTQYNRTSFTEILHTTGGQNKMSSTINYNYDANGLLTREVRTGQPGIAYDADIVRNAYSPSETTLTALNSIRLTTGFHVPSGATFRASIDNKDEVLERTIRYPQTINAGTYASMSGANLLNYPVEETTRFNGSVVGSKLMTYRSENGIFVPDKVYSMESDVPLSSFSAFNGTAKDPHYGSEPEAEYITYNASGKIVKTKDRRGIYTYYVWAYDNSYPVAKIESSVNTSIAISVNDANLSYSSVSSTVKNDVVYLQGLISSALNSLGLSSALVSIYTYKPLVGMTSQTDPNGITSYYEYDNNGRLSVIRDDNEHIIKTYQYNYVSGQD